jgi:hypothetical protein
LGLLPILRKLGIWLMVGSCGSAWGQVCNANATRRVALWVSNWFIANQSMHRTMLFPPQRHLTFARFESRPGSVHARSASAQFGMREGIVWQEPMLILAGRPGAGKTHLLHATANLAKRNAHIRSGITISAQRLAEEVQRATHFGDLPFWRDRCVGEDFLAVDDVHALFGSLCGGDDFLLDVLHLRGEAKRRTLVSASLSTAPDKHCPLNTFLNHQRAVRLL